MQTPWGLSQHCEVLSNGIEFHSTASHGGYRLSEEHKKVMRAKKLPVKTWYEEDCECLYVIKAFPELFSRYFDRFETFDQGMIELNRQINHWFK